MLTVPGFVFFFLFLRAMIWWVIRRLSVKWINRMSRFFVERPKFVRMSGEWNTWVYLKNGSGESNQDLAKGMEILWSVFCSFLFEDRKGLQGHVSSIFYGGETPLGGRYAINRSDFKECFARHCWLGGAPKSNSKKFVPIKKRAEPNTQDERMVPNTTMNKVRLAVAVTISGYVFWDVLQLPWGGLVRTEKNILVPQSNGSHLSCRTFRSDDFPLKSCKVKSRVIAPFISIIGG